MKHFFFCTQSNSRVIFLFLLALLCTKPLIAQTDFQIMVNGSWTYVVDPHPNNDPYPAGKNQKRIIVVAPLSGHSAYFFPGSNARLFGMPGDEVMAGVYYLDFDPTVRTFTGMPSADDIGPVTYSVSQRVDSNIVKSVVDNPEYNQVPHVIISLPVPDYYTTYIGDYGLGLAESKVDSKHITPSSPAKEYTIWMVLHYAVTQSGDVTLRNVPYGGATEMPTKVRTPVRNAVSLAVGLQGTFGDKYCDSYSSISFSASKQLWGVVHYARYPEQADYQGTQNRGVYHYDCNEAKLSDLLAMQKAYEAAQRSYLKALVTIGDVKDCLKTKFLKSSVGKKQSTGQSSNSACDLKAEKSSLDNIRDTIRALSFGGIPLSISEDLEITDKLVTCDPTGRDQKKPCPTLPISRDVIENFILNKVSTFLTATAVGGTDCHMGQTSIDGAIQ